VPSWVAPTRVRWAACAACPAAWPRPHEPETQTRPCHQTAFIEQLLRVLRRGASVCQLLVECGVDSTAGAAQDRDHRDAARVASQPPVTQVRCNHQWTSLSASR
jgi:hypothetical protein